MEPVTEQEAPASRARYPSATSGLDLARRTTLGVLTAVLAVLVVRGAALTAGLDLGPTGAQTPFGVGPVVASAVVAGAGAAVVYAVLVRRTARPARTFVAVSALVFLGMMVPVVAVAPSMDVTGTGQAVLTAMHLAVAAPLVAFVVGAIRL
jgi:hypothetical protein